MQDTSFAGTSERSESAWKADTPLLRTEPLTRDTEADVCVIGAGIAGMTTAYLLAREGKRVVVLDDNAVAGGETGQSTAHLASEQDDRFYEIERLHGQGGARLTYESHQRAVERVGEISREEGIDCEHRLLDAYLFLAPEHDRSELDQELEAAQRAGFTDAEMVNRVPGLSGYDGPAIRFPHQGQFDPVKYVTGLATAVARLGGRVYTGTHVVDVQGGDQPFARTRENFRVVANDAVVVATNSPVNDRLTIHTKQAPYRTYVVGLRLPAGSLPTALWWDTGEAYHYIRLQHGGDGAEDGGDVLLVGGEDHKTGHADDAEDRYAALERWTREHFPQAGETVYRWSGQVMEPMDFLGFIGRDPGHGEKVYIATGDSGQGTTHGTIAGMLLTDLIMGRPNPWATLYDPSRRALGVSSLEEFVIENAKVAADYTDWVTRKDVDSVDEIPLGAGAVMRRGVAPIAVYRDPRGTVHQHSAVCTHLGCIVRWNSEETSWDCPCHGSRFHPESGEPLNGPAITGLRPAGEE